MERARRRRPALLALVAAALAAFVLLALSGALPVLELLGLERLRLGGGPGEGPAGTAPEAAAGGAGSEASGPRLQGRAGELPPEAPPEPAAPPRVPTASLSGYVLDEEGRGVAGAEVEACRPPSGPLGALGRGYVALLLGEGPAFVAPQDAGARATTAQDGSFRLSAAPQGAIRLRARARGFALGTVDHVLGPVGADTAVVLTLSAAGELRGRVLDERGRAVPGARVAFASPHPLEDFGGEPPAPPSLTDAAGHFGPVALARDEEVGLRVLAEGYRMLSRTVRAGAEPLELRLTPGVPVEVLVTYADDGSPVAGAELVLFEDEQPGEGQDEQVGARAVTDARGRARTRAGERLSGAMLTLPGEAPALWEPDDDEPGDLEGPRPLVWPPPSGVLPLRLVRARRLRGRVVDPDGRPVAGLHVVLAGLLGGVCTQVRTDAEGAFELRGRGGFGGWFGEALFVHGPAWRTQLVTPPPLPAGGRDPEPLTITVVPASSVRGRVLDAQGRPLPGARIGWQQELENGTVLPPRGDGQALLRRAPTFSGPDGRFLLQGLGDERVRLRARHPVFPDAVSGVVALVPGRIGEAGDLVCPAGGTLLVRLEDERGRPLARACLTAQAGDGEAARLHDGAWEGWWDDDGEPAPRRFALSDARGEARLTGLFPGKVHVEVRARGHLPWVAAATVPAEGAAELTLRPPVQRVLSGTLVDPEGRPLSGLIVRAVASPPRPPDLPPGSAGEAAEAAGGRACGGSSEPRELGVPGVLLRHAATTGEDGSFRFEHLPGTAVRLQVQHPGYRPLTLSLPEPREGLRVALVRHLLAPEQRERLRALEAEVAALEAALEEAGVDDPRRERLTRLHAEAEALRTGEPLVLEDAGPR